MLCVERLFNDAHGTLKGALCGICSVNGQVEALFIRVGLAESLVLIV